MKFSDIADYGLEIPTNRDSLGYHISQVEKETKITLKKCAPCGSLLATLSYVLEGRCASILPWTAVYNLVEMGLLQAARVVEPEIKRDVFIYTSRERRLTNAMQKIIGLIKESTELAHQQGRWHGELLIQ